MVMTTVHLSVFSSHVLQTSKFNVVPKGGLVHHPLSRTPVFNLGDMSPPGDILTFPRGHEVSYEKYLVGSTEGPKKYLV